MAILIETHKCHMFFSVLQKILRHRMLSDLLLSKAITMFLISAFIN